MGKSLTRDEIKVLYHPPVNRFVEVNVPALSYVVLDGIGDPAGGAYQRAVKWLFATIVPIRKIAKEKMGASFVEPPLETLYWTDGKGDLASAPKAEWRWRAMIVLAEWMNEAIFADAVAKVAMALGDAPESLRMEEMHEGRSVQFIHEGPPDRESDMVARLYEEYLPSHGLAPNGSFHEIYLTDATRVAPEKLRTVLRQPVKRVI
jgi:hypothetical protein